MAMVEALADTSPKALEKFSKRLPSKIEAALDFPTVREMTLACGEKKIKAYIEYELIKLAERVSVGGNLNDAQVEFICDEFIRVFPNETIADFKLCFQRGAIGQYGDIFRIDGIVVRRWMEKYLEEKYQVIENMLMAEKEDFKKQLTFTPSDAAKIKADLDRKKLQEWLDAVQNSPMTKKARPLSDDEIREEGQTKPRKALTYKPIYSEAETLAKLKLQRAASEFYKGKKAGFTLKIFNVDGIEFTAENEDDAMQIYELAEQMKVKIVNGKVVWL